VNHVSKPSAICVSYEVVAEGDLSLLREAVENVDQGIVIIDNAMRVCLVNAKARAIWRLRDEHCAGRPLFSEFIYNIAAAGAYDLSPDELAGYVLRRFETVNNGDSTPVDIRTRNGRIIRAQVTPLPSGGRMLTHTDITDLIQHADHFRQLANSDALTGLPNQRDFLARARAEWDRFRRYHAPFCIAVVDIDRFKRINDQFGHDVGDRAILHVGCILEHSKRVTDVVARTGGDEFCILMPNTSVADAASFADRLRRAVAHHPLYADEKPISATISIGIAEAQDSLLGVEVVIKTADERLYAAKRHGRDVCIAAEGRAL
jgi:diguanylate cyclase (GGDEF)-like protein